MNATGIRPGDRLTIGAKSGDGPERAYTSHVKEILDEHRLLVHTPMCKGNMVKLAAGNGYHFQFYARDGLYKAEGAVLKCFIQGDGFFTEIKAGALQHIQRRGLYRVDVAFDFIYTRLTDQATPGRMKPAYKGTARDISGSGLRFASDVPLAETERIVCRLPLNGAFISAKGEVLAVHPPENGSDERDVCVYRTRFIEIESERQEKIIQYVFDTQRRIMAEKRKEARETRNAAGNALDAM